MDTDQLGAGSGRMGEAQDTARPHPSCAVFYFSLTWEKRCEQSDPGAASASRLSSHDVGGVEVGMKICCVMETKYLS